ncbi:aspartyl protease family protein 1-like isoform X2 [Phoenix dactylifera]|uniref:Aspartyl protease family protein 1-like isoform X2 n=1 Tax=Phoenix dactylifera TaxID=42345 RepID=A0A8B7CIV6_PHODC|nr:aspartyl protease family protein 1-like isoform X2 [Phoenix dactylifera]
MAAAFSSSSILLVFFFLICGGGTVAALGLSFHHRFSDLVRRWAESRAKNLPGGWPEKDTVEYYAALAGHDRGQALSGAAPALTFSDGNATLQISSLGFLHYAMVSVGTPSLTFMVALDTGSDLFWVPCDCSSCAPATSGSFGNDFEFSIYSPNMSLTSQRVLCNSSLCELQRECTVATRHCPYKIAYVSADTSSSGILVEDVLYLTAEDPRLEVVEARIVFGCGQVQTGSFLDVAAPDGLFGLGMEKISVPSILSSRGLTSDSFSMCFGRDGVGRISFGDNGSSDQEETPFNLNHLHPTYNISITGVSVGSSSIDADFSSLFDTGTSFTYLADPAYTYLSESFNAQVQDRRQIPDSRIPFEYCYHKSSNATKIQIPDLSLITKGGSHFPVSEPVIVISIQHEYVYCLGIVKSSKLNIIGQNFMTGLRIVFDRERNILGWKRFNCYESEDSNPLPVNPKNSSALSPPVPKNYTPEAMKGNGTQVTVPTPPLSHSSHLDSMSRILILLLLSLTIL